MLLNSQSHNTRQITQSELKVAQVNAYSFLSHPAYRYNSLKLFRKACQHRGERKERSTSSYWVGLEVCDGQSSTLVCQSISFLKIGVESKEKWGECQ